MTNQPNDGSGIDPASMMIYRGHELVPGHEEWARYRHEEALRAPRRGFSDVGKFPIAAALVAVAVASFFIVRALA